MTPITDVDQLMRELNIEGEVMQTNVAAASVDLTTMEEAKQKREHAAKLVASAEALLVELRAQNQDVSDVANIKKFFEQKLAAAQQLENQAKARYSQALTGVRDAGKDHADATNDFVVSSHDSM